MTKIRIDKKTKWFFHCSLLLTVVVLAESSFALEEIEKISYLNPMPGPDHRNIGWEWHFIDQDNKAGKMQKTAGNQEIASYIRTDGCEWTRSTQGFAPATQWENCPSKGTSSVELVSGEIWPLTVGSKFVYTVQGTSSLFGKAWKSKRSCKVDSQWRIQIVSGEYETFKVICKERWGKRTWWLSPKVGTAVAYKQTNIRGGLLLQEMTRIIAPE